MYAYNINPFTAIKPDNWMAADHHASGYYDWTAQSNLRTGRVTAEQQIIWKIPPSAAGQLEC